MMSRFVFLAFGVLAWFGLLALSGFATELGLQQDGVQQEGMQSEGAEVRVRDEAGR